MGKIAFSASKDPLLTEHSPREREEISALEAHLQNGAAGASSAVDGSPPGTSSPATEPAGVDDTAHELPAGAAAQSAPAPGRGAPKRRASRRRAAADDGPVAVAETAGMARRVQTSISLPPDAWVGLDELARASGYPARQLLVGVLAASLPTNVEDALQLTESLVVGLVPDSTHEPNEERNYRLPLPVRRRLDALAGDLGPRVTRSLLIHAILARHLPSSAADAHALMTRELVASMRIAAGSVAARDTAGTVT